MPKFAIDRFPAGFFDITQDLARRLPVGLIEQWIRGDRTHETALRLLSANAVFGSVVSSDSAGLTRLTRARGLIEMLALINRPKELLHAYGRALGGESIGIWAADNTEMLYPLAVPPRDVLAMLLTAMERIRKESELQVGLCAHTGCFFQLGGGVYGTEADKVEGIAEDYTEGGEVVVTEEFRDALGEDHGFTLERRNDLRTNFGDVWRVNGGPRRTDLAPVDLAYPYPYSHEFYADLRRFADDSGNMALLEELHVRYTQKRVVVLIEREREETDVPEIAVLNDLALSGAMARIGAELLGGTEGVLIKTAGALGIYTFPDVREALEFARKFREVFLAQQVACRIGIDEGEVLVFDVDADVYDIAGMPVNLASKMAQDHGEFGRIYLSEAAARSADVSHFERQQFRISGVDIEAFAG